MYCKDVLQMTLALFELLLVAEAVVKLVFRASFACLAYSNLEIRASI